MPQANSEQEIETNYLKDYIENKNFSANEETISSEFETIRLNLNKPLNPSDYLCTLFTAYLTHEPCSMCSMALVHARISKVYYVFERKHGFLNSNCKLHCLSSLNHNYEVFKAKQPSLDLEPELFEYYTFNK